MHLNEQQKNALETVRWLFWGDRRSGRTYTIACAAIIQAQKYPGEWVAAYDHMPTLNDSNHMLSLVRDLIEEDKELSKLNWTFKPGAFMLNKEGEE